MKRNTYTLTLVSNSIILNVCLGIRNGKKFDYGIGRREGRLIYWKGTYSDTPVAWEMFIERCSELHSLGVKRDYKVERNEIK